MSQWLHRLYPTASEPLEIAARAQHIRRWLVPRSNFPVGRAGYLAWRTQLYGFHAEQVTALLREIGYEESMISRVGQIVSKRGLKQDPDVQRIEDVACLVFLNYDFAEFVSSHPRDKVISIVRKTWDKMSETARRAAGELSLPEGISQLLAEALQPGAASVGK